MTLCAKIAHYENLLKELTPLSYLLQNQNVISQGMLAAAATEDPLLKMFT